MNPFPYPERVTPLASILIATLCFPLIGQRPAETPLRVAVVLDGASSVTDSVRVGFEHEIADFMGSGPGVSFPEQLRVSGDWTADGVNAALDRLFANRSVDVVVAFGPIGSHLLARRRNVPKPAIAALIVDAGVQDLPASNGASGVPNLSYVDIAFATTRTLEAFHRIVPYRRLAILVHPGIPATMPQLATTVRSHAQALGATVTVVPVTVSASDALQRLPSDADAVYLGVLEQLPAPGFDSLIQALTDRNIPTFSVAGRADAERGVLASYAARDDLARRARRVASSIQRIRNGEDAGTLPVTLTALPQLTINMATARAIGYSPGWDILTEAELLNEEPSAKGPVWSLAAVGREALSANLDLKAADQGLQSGEQATRISRSALLPQAQAEATGTVIRDETAAASLGQKAQREAGAKLAFSQSIYDDQNWAAYRVARYTQDSRVASRQRTELEVVLRATTAYLNVLRTRALARVERENLTLTRSNLEVAQLKERVGASGLSDVYRWQAELAQSRRKVLDADAQVRLAALELNSALDRPLEEAFQTAEAGVDDPALLISEPRLLKYLGNPAIFSVFRDFEVQEGLAISPEVQSLDAQIRAEERKATAASRSFFLPSLTLEGGVTSVLARGGDGSTPPTIGPVSVARGPDQTWSVQLKASLPLFTGLAQSARLAQAHSERERLSVARQSTALSVSQQIRGSLQLAAASWANITQARAAADAAHKNLDLVTDAYARGAVNVITLLDAQQSSLEANEAAANAVYGFLIDLMKVQRAAGRFDFFFSAEEREAYYQRLEAFYRAAGFSPAEP